MENYVAVSEFTRQSIVEHLRIPPERVHTIYHAINTAHFRPFPNARAYVAEQYNLSFKQGEIYLLYVGNELPRKNLKTLLHGIALLRETGYAVQLIKVGGASGQRWREQFLMDIGQHRLEDIVTIVQEFVPDSDLPAFYSAADLLVHPSLIEGFGFPVLEAMACGLPVVCSDAGALTEITGNNALHFDGRNVDSLVASVQRGIDDSALREDLRQRGLLRSQQFSPALFTSKLLDVYQKAAAQ
ncbi:MAG: glycosyltransferase family 4 protein [Chloroflexi bacterium]|nr:glycosyltransferase family 4 protein [Chloroflexota bacterium]